MILAREAFANGYSPVGAILTVDNEVVSMATSQRKIGNAQHAEFLTLHGWQRSGFPDSGGSRTLYSTLESCIMCCGMATVLKVDRIVWLVDDIWAGGTRLLNYNMPYVQKRFPTIMEKITIPHLYLEALEMWVKYLRSTGHADAVSFMLGLPEDYQCKLL